MSAGEKWQLCFIFVMAGMVAGLPAGPLTPPGAPSPTNKPLSQVEPRVAINMATMEGGSDCVFLIGKPGSYYLTERIEGVAGKNGIKIEASRVTIDLMGFSMEGVEDSLCGITTSGPLEQVVIRNGMISNWGGSGILLNGEGGGRDLVVADIVSSENGTHGILLGAEGRIAKCDASLNAGDGIHLQSGIVNECTANECGGIGIHVEQTGLLSKCLVRLNGSDGFKVGRGSTMEECSAMGNLGGGIITGLGCTVDGCSAIDNSSDGIRTGIGNLIANCTSMENGGVGIVSGATGSVLNCTVFRSGSHGISTGQASMVLNNTCSENGRTSIGAGIYANIYWARIEGNNCVNNDYGFWVSGSKNIIVRNTCKQNTVNYQIANSNQYGPILNLTAMGFPGASGDSAPGTIGSADPWVNLAY